jgi:hypothetical protein
MNVKQFNLVKQPELVLIYLEHINVIVSIVLVDKIVKWYAPSWRETFDLKISLDT